MLEIVAASGRVYYPLYIRRDTSEIDYLEDLRAISVDSDSLSGYYKLMRNLDFQDPNSYRSGEINREWTVEDFGDLGDTGWAPIGDSTTPFSGEFDGNGYAISGLQINRNTEDSQGLFGNIGDSGTVFNLGLPNVRIEGGTQVGAVVGNHSGKIANSYATGTISAVGSVGGIVGIAEDSSVIVNSRSSIRVSATVNNIGGMVGSCADCIILNSFAVGVVEGVGSNATSIGGLIGGLITTNNANISNNYAWVDVSGGDSDDNGAFVGHLNSDGGESRCQLCHRTSKRVFQQFYGYVDCFPHRGCSELLE